MEIVPHVSYVFDEGFQYPTLISVFSLCKATSGKVDVSLFVPETNAELVDAVARLNDHFVNASVEIVASEHFSIKAKTDSNHLTSTAYGRLFLNKFLNRKTIYLDGDTLIFRDIAELYLTDMQGKPVAGCRDSGALIRDNRASRKLFPKLSRLHKHIFEQPHNFDVATYINSGVLIIDFNRIKELDLGLVFDIERAVQAKLDGKWYFHDQDWINHTLRGNIHLIPPEWNSIWGNPNIFFPFASCQDMIAFSGARTNPAIIHFTGKYKPWNPAKKLQTRQKRKMYALYAQFKHEADAALGISYN